MAGIPTATPTAACAATQVLTWLNAECAALNASLQDDWFNAGCPDGAGEGCYASSASTARFEQTFEGVQKWLDGAIWRATMDHIAGRTPDLPEDLRELWAAYEMQFRIMSSLVDHTSLDYTHDLLVNKIGRFAERVAARATAAAEPEPEDSDEPLRCPKGCGDCGGSGCGLTRSDIGSDPHPLDGPQSFQAITATCSQFGELTDYAAGLLWVPAESALPMQQIYMIAREIYRRIDPWKQDQYSTISWTSLTQGPDQAPRKSASGLYQNKVYYASFGGSTIAPAHDGVYYLGDVSHHNMASWSFKVETIVEGTPEYERYNALASVWEHLEIDIPHDPYVIMEDYAAYDKRAAEEAEAKRHAAAAARYAKRVALHGTYKEAPGGPEEYAWRDRMAHHSDRVDREEGY